MPYINEDNFEKFLTPRVRDEYWRRVKFSLRTYFRKSEDLAERFRQTMDASSALEQMLVYHKNPLTLAADLAGIDEVAAEHIADYHRRYGELISPLH